MEGSSHSNSSASTMHLNHSSTSVNSTMSKTYNVSPLPLEIKGTLTVIMAFIGTVGIVANSLLFHIVRKQEKIRRRGRTAKSYARILTPYFIQSLALSDFLCSLANLPLFISQLYSDIVQNDWGCKCVRYMNLFFAVVTLNNLLVIGMERYMAMFYPFLLPSPKFCKTLVILAWISGALIVMVPIVTFTTSPVDLGPSEYTIICKYDKTVPAYRAMFIGFTAICYTIPSIILIVTSVRILVFLRRRKQDMKSEETGSGNTSNTKMFVSLIFVFIIPYCLYVVYSGLNIALKMKFSFTVDYVVRRVSGIIAYSNAVVSPTIIFSSMPSLRNTLRNLLRKLFCLKPKVTVTVPAVPAMEGGSLRHQLSFPKPNFEEEIQCQSIGMDNIGYVRDDSQDKGDSKL